jgi:hypothetical protein
LENKNEYYNSMNPDAQGRVGTNASGMLDGKPEKKRRLGRPRRRWKHSSIVYLQEVGIRCGQYSYILVHSYIVVHNRAAGRPWRQRKRT